MGLDRGPWQDPSPQQGDPDPREGQTQANCGVWPPQQTVGTGTHNHQPAGHAGATPAWCP